MSEANKSGSRHYYRLPPCPAYDVEGTESWLEDMAEKGFFLTQDGFFVGFGIFEKRAPGKVRYRLEAAPRQVSMWAEDGGEPDGDARQLNEEFGWEYLGSRGQFYIYRAENPAAPEMNTDPQVQALAVNAVHKRERNNVIRSVLVFIAVWLVDIKAGFLTLIMELGTPFAVFSVGLLLWLLCVSIAGAVHLERLRKRLMAGEGLDHGKDWDRKAAHYRARKLLFPAMVTLWAVWLLCMWSEDIMDENLISLHDFEGSVPFATLEDFSEGEYTREIWGFSNTVEIKSDILAPEIIHWREVGHATDGEGEEILSGGLHVDYYRTASPVLAKALATEFIMREKLDRSGFTYRYKRLETPQVEADFAAAYIDSTGMTNIIICLDEVMLRAMFYKTSTKAVTLQQWAEIMYESIK